MKPGIVPEDLPEAIDSYRAGLSAATAAQLAGAGSAAYYLRQVALESLIAQRMAVRAVVSIHHGLLAGATLAQVTGAAGMSSAEVAARWQSWADGQRGLEQQVPGLGLSERDYRRAAAVIGAAAVADSGPVVFPGARAGAMTQIGSPHP